MRASVLLTAVLFVACAREEFVDHATLLREPAAKLRFSGAFELAHVAGERAMTFEGPQGAFDGYILGTQATEQEVHAYYARELERLGWRPDRLAGISSTAETIAWGWCKPGLNYRLAIKDQPRAFQPEFYQGQSFRTVFDARLVSRHRTNPCPSP